jgi:hypothetical protein
MGDEFTRSFGRRVGRYRTLDGVGFAKGSVLPLAIDRRRRCEYHARVSVIYSRLEHDAGPVNVDVGVGSRMLEAWTNTGERGEVYDRVEARLTE